MLALSDSCGFYFLRFILNQFVPLVFQEFLPQFLGDLKNVFLTFKSFQKFQLSLQRKAGAFTPRQLSCVFQDPHDSLAVDHGHTVQNVVLDIEI